MTPAQERKTLERMRQKFVKENPGFFESLEALYVFAAEHKENTLINWANPTKKMKQFVNKLNPARNVQIGALKIEETQIEIRFFKRPAPDNTVATYQIIGRGTVNLTDERLAALKDFAVAALALYKDVYNKAK